MSSSRPIISVVVPVYNCRASIANTLGSIQDQTFDDFEVLVIDDGSTDDSAQFIEPILVDSRFKLVRHDVNQGLAAARNTGIDGATGDYITFIDGGDFVLPSYLENLYAATENGEKDSARTNYHVFSETGEITASSSGAVKTVDEFLQKMVYGGVPNMACCVLFRLSRLKENGIYFPKQRVAHEDLAFTPLAYRVMNDIGFTDSHDYLWVETPGSLSRSFTEHHVDSTVFLIRELYDGHKQDFYTAQERTLRKAFYWRHLLGKSTNYPSKAGMADYILQKLDTDPLLQFGMSDVELLNGREKRVFLGSLAAHTNSDFHPVRQRLFGPYLEVAFTQDMTFAHLAARLISTFFFKRYAGKFQPNVTFAFLLYSVLRRIKAKIFG